MPFPTQTYKNNCGAFCACYFNWLEAGRTPEKGPQPGDDDMINDVYKAVMVGDAAVPSLPYDYCDPVKMIDFLRKFENTDAAFYLSEKSAVNGILKEMRADGAPEKDKIDELEAGGRLRYSPPVVPEKGQAAIAVYYVVEAKGSQLIGMHYLLFRRGEKGQLFCYNPWRGEADPVTGYEHRQIGDLLLWPADAAIVITRKKEAQ